MLIFPGFSMWGHGWLCYEGIFFWGLFFLYFLLLLGDCRDSCLGGLLGGC